jgi:hypothetical protein
VIASIVSRPAYFDRVDRVKLAFGDVPQPGDDGLWILGGALEFTVNGATHYAPAGFTLDDGGSIPRIGRFLAPEPCADPRRWPVVAHHWLYMSPKVVKAYADEALRALLRSEGADWWSCNVLYYSARWGGAGIWTNRHW